MNGFEAYREDCRLQPLYHDGTPRRAWAQLSDVCQYSWNRDPRPRVDKDVFPSGAYFPLPEGLTWTQLAEARKRWDIDPSHAPLAVGPGVVAWGVPTGCNYRMAQ